MVSVGKNICQRVYSFEIIFILSKENEFQKNIFALYLGRFCTKHHCPLLLNTCIFHKTNILRLFFQAIFSVSDTLRLKWYFLAITNKTKSKL